MYREETARPQITWKFQNICSSDDYYVNLVRSPAEELFSIQVRRRKDNLQSCKGQAATEIEAHLSFSCTFPSSSKWIFPDLEKTAFADMYKSLFYKQQLLLNNKIAKTDRHQKTSSVVHFLFEAQFNRTHQVKILPPLPSHPSPAIYQMELLYKALIQDTKQTSVTLQRFWTTTID